MFNNDRKLISLDLVLDCLEILSKFVVEMQLYDNVDNVRTCLLKDKGIFKSPAFISMGVRPPHSLSLW